MASTGLTREAVDTAMEGEKVAAGLKKKVRQDQITVVSTLTTLEENIMKHNKLTLLLQAREFLALKRKTLKKKKGEETPKMKKEKKEEKEIEEVEESEQLFNYSFIVSVMIMFALLLRLLCWINFITKGNWI